MKTTLKRGIGRAAELNGNGRAVYPPAVAAPRTRYRQPEPGKRSLGLLFGKIVLWIVIAALMGLYVLDDEAIERLPDKGDHETSTFPELAEEGKLLAFRHEGLWLTVNTPKDLRAAEEWFAAAGRV